MSRLLGGINSWRTLYLHCTVTHATINLNKSGYDEAKWSSKWNIWSLAYRSVRWGVLYSPCSRGAIPFPCPGQFFSLIACSAFFKGVWRWKHGTSESSPVISIIVGGRNNDPFGYRSTGCMLTFSYTSSGCEKLVIVICLFRLFLCWNSWRIFLKPKVNAILYLVQIFKHPNTEIE